KAKGWHAIEEPPEGDLSFESRQGRAQAVVDALSEGQVAVPLAPPVADLALLELRLVAIRRGQDTVHEGAPRDGDAGDLDLLARVAFGRHLDRAVEAQQLLHRGRVE